MSTNLQSITEDGDFSVIVTCKDVFNETELEQTFDDIMSGLDLIRAALEAKEEYNFYKIFVATPNAPDEYSPQPTAWGGFSVWGIFGRGFWHMVAPNAHFRPHIEAYFDKVETTLRGASGQFLEDTDVAFAEPVVSCLAMIDVAFVPYYTRLLGLWDMSLEAHQFEVINNIIQKHGLCAETEELLYVRTCTAATGHHGMDHISVLLPFLDEQLGGFTSSPLFHRMVTSWVPNPSDKEARAVLFKVLDFLEYQYGEPTDLKKSAERILTLN